MNKKVLIIEDNKNLAESLKNIFVKKKINVKVSHSAQQAEQLISVEHYDLLITDVVLPKMNGIAFLKYILSKGLLHSNCKIWIMSGVLNEQVISRDMIGHIDEFLKKPLNMSLIKKKIDTVFAPSDNSFKKLSFFYLNPEENSKKNLLGNQEHIIKGHELMFIYFYLCFIRFNGVLYITYQGVKKKDEILFTHGNIASFKSPDKKSYLGALLIKNNLVSQADIKKILAQNNDIPLGESLVSECYISPHQLHKVLREQMAVRLFTAMEHVSVVVSCMDFIPSQAFDHMTHLEINHLLALVNHWVHSKVSIEWLRDFFKTPFNLRIYPVTEVISKKWLLSKSGFEFTSLKSLDEPQTISHLLKNMDEKTEEKIIRELYCRILIRENYLEIKAKSASQESHQLLRKKYETFFQESKIKNYFELLNLPVNAPNNKVELAYKNMVKIFHPDRIDKNSPPDLVKICNQCFILIVKIYETLTDPVKRKEYMYKLDEKARADEFAVKELYMIGKKNVEESQYSKALEKFKSIINNPIAPSDTSLYYIWAIIKNRDYKIGKEEREEIMNLFNKVSLEYKESPVFYFVKGLLMKTEGKRKLAFGFFKKAFDLDSKFKEARMERYSLSVSKKKKISFGNLFKKAN